MSNGLTVVLDTNVLISGLAFPGSTPGSIISAWRSGGLDVVLSEYILDELRRVMPKLQHRHGMSIEAIDDLVDIVRFWVQTVEPDDTEAVDIRDPFDKAILGTFFAAKRHHQARYLITGDKDLTSLAHRYNIITPAEFWLKHGGL
ncbi:putative toxin-antitoxin system toxin component, PIN family [Saccharospirillum sp.]|uniref:putative toxin-antitoxin system toxin component, PIN family n=1 Tax=Saccharospirillum sp. TaxID=2033801 RepID=UPI0034A0496E